MLNWDMNFLKKLRKLGISVEMFRRYVDDIVVFLNTINNGCKYNKKKNLMEYSDVTLADESDELRIMNTLKEIPDSIDENVQFTTDSLENHEDLRMPVLDLKMWVIESEGKFQLVHSFYKKKVSNPFTILERSAMSSSIKSNTIYQEELRRLRNVSPLLKWEEAVPHMNEFVNMLRISGYNKAYRYNAIKGAIDRIKTVRKNVKDKIWESQYRTRDAIAKAKAEKGGNSPATWFLKGNVTNTLTCTSTKDSKLQLALTETLRSGEQPIGGRTLVLEDGGLPVTLGLKKRDPFRVNGCTFKDKKCIVSPNTDCSRQGQVYIITCKSCKSNVYEGPKPMVHPKWNEAGGEGRANYIGMTGTSLHARAASHLAAVTSKNKSNALYMHILDVHMDNANEVEFEMKACTSHRRVISRYKTEAIYIEKQSIGTSMNARLKGGHGGLVRLDTRIDRT